MMDERRVEQKEETMNDDSEDSAKLIPDDHDGAKNVLESSSSSSSKSTILISTRTIATMERVLVFAVSFAFCFLIVFWFVMSRRYPSGAPLVSNTCSSASEEEDLLNGASSWEALVYRSALLPPEDRCWRRQPRNDLPCLCPSALEPYPHNDTLGEPWNKAFQRNLDLVATHKNDNMLDVVLLGDSMTEHWLGTDLGRPNKKWKGNHQVYQNLFSSAGAPLKGVALGIGGDRVPNLVYRLLHGEAELSSAKVYWLLIGINDHLGGEKCNSDMIVSGNIHTVQLLRALAPNASVVVNSLLPFGEGNLNERPGWLFLHGINERLACYASAAPNVEFFNATSLFLVNNDVHAQQVNMSLLSVDKFHPGAKGSEIWGNAIVKKVQELIQK